MERKRMPNTRDSITHKFTILGGHKKTVIKNGKPTELYQDIDGYLVVGMYENGRIGEIFLTIGKHGCEWKSFECLMIAVSVGLQYGIPLEIFSEKFKHMRFEPFGVMKSSDIPMSSSIVDYVFRWLDMEFPGGYWKGAKKDGIEKCFAEDEG